MVEEEEKEEGKRNKKGKGRAWKLQMRLGKRERGECRRGEGGRDLARTRPTCLLDR